MDETIRRRQQLREDERLLGYPAHQCMGHTYPMHGCPCPDAHKRYNVGGKFDE